MRPMQTSRHATAILLCLLVVTGGIAPMVGATHGNEPATPRPWQGQSTGQPLVDSVLGTGTAPLNEHADAVDEAFSERVEPQVPATFFHDRFHPSGDRIGGWGPWQSQDPSGWMDETPWHLDASGAADTVSGPWPVPYERDLEQGFRFGDTTDYAIDDARTNFALLSPVISLRSLPVDARDERHAVPGLTFPDGRAGIGDEGEIDLAYEHWARDRLPPACAPFTTLCLQQVVQSGQLIGQGAKGTGQNPAEPDRIMLYMDHKYHFAYGDPQVDWNPNQSCGSAGNLLDINQKINHYGCRSSSLSQIPPREDPTDGNINVTTLSNHQMDWGRVLVVPENGDMMQATVLQPLRQPYIRHNDQTERPSQCPCDGTGPSVGFSGSSGAPGSRGAEPQFVEEAFDLTPWAGQDVRLVFQAQVNKNFRTAYFTETSLFNETEIKKADPFYGWAVSNVRVEGPAHMHNVRLDRMADPLGTGPFPTLTRSDPAPHRDGDFVAGVGSLPMPVLTLNRGRVTENVTVSLTAQWPETDAEGNVTVREATCTAPARDLRPGDAVAVEVPLNACAFDNATEGSLDIVEGVEYEVTFDARLNALESLDDYVKDNAMGPIRVVGEGPDFVFRGGLSTIGSALVAPTNEVEVTVPIWNRGAGAGRVELTMDVERQAPQQTAWAPLNPSDEQFARFDPSKEAQIAGRGIHEETWPFRPMEPGLYRLTVTATAPDGTAVQATKTIGAWVAPEFAYDINFQDPAEDDGTVIPGTDWDTNSLLDLRPPGWCEDAGDIDPCDHQVLELSRDFQVPGSQESDRATAALRGDFSMEGLDAGTLVEALEVEFRHYAKDIRCFDFSCPNGGGMDGGDKSPQNRLSVRLVDGPPGGDYVPTQSTNLAGRAYQRGYVNLEEIQHLGGSHYRNTYYNGQWLDEKHTVPVMDFLATEQNTVTAAGAPQDGVHLGRLKGSALEFVAEYRGKSGSGFDRGGDDCLFGEPDAALCPVWRIAEATVSAVPVGGGPRIKLLHWSGAPGSQETGTWFSHGSPEKKQHEVSGPVIGTRPVLTPTEESFWPFCSDLQLTDRATAAVEDSDATNAPGHVANTAADAGEASGHRALDNNMRCTLWHKVNVAELAGGADPAWELDTSEGALFETGGAWSNAKRQGSATWEYDESPGGRIDQLLSPVFKVPDGDPRVKFWYRHMLHNYASGANYDTGTVMVRFFDAEGAPTTPFLPVPIDPNNPLKGNACNGDCDRPLLKRAPVEVDLPLANFPLLDYRDPSESRLEYPVTIGNQGTFLGVASGAIVAAQGRSTSNPDERIPDPQRALAAFDLRACVEGKPTLSSESPKGTDFCNVQFAFRLDAPDWDDSGARENDREATLHGGPSNPYGQGERGQEGWFIDGFRILRDTRIDFDLALTDVKVTADTDYDWQELGFGPGTDATATLTVESRGVFPVRNATFHVTIRDAEGGAIVGRYHVENEPDFEMAEGDQETVKVPFTLPSAGFYNIAFSVIVGGDIIKDVIPIRDARLGNDCLALKGDGHVTMDRDATGDCKFSARTPFLHVAPNPRLSVDATVEPVAAKASPHFPRTVDVRVHNDGNVIAEGAVLSLVTQKAGDPNPGDVRNWVIHRSPGPNLDASWTELTLFSPDILGDFSLLEHCLGIESAQELRDDADCKEQIANLRNDIPLTTPDAARYFVTATLTSLCTARGTGNCGGDDWTALDQVAVESFDSIYSDTFGPGGIQSDFDKVRTGEVAPLHPGWKLGQAPGLKQDVVPMWRFGDAATDRYNQSADASLELPGIDLSRAQRASLSITHNHALEEGYDGARVEVSTDEGATWTPLEPARPGAYRPISADSPLNPDNDTALDTRGFTGRSMDDSPQTGGWVIDEFNLAQIPGFTAPAVVKRFGLDHVLEGGEGPHLSEGQLARFSGDERVTFHSLWSDEGRSCLDGCWHRENLNHANPPPLCTALDLPVCDELEDDQYWWSGSAQGYSNSKQPGTRLVLDFEWAGTDEQSARLVFWYWKDASGTLKVYDAASPDTGFSASGRSDGWERGELWFGNEEEFSVYFDQFFPSTDNANRGAVIGAVTLETVVRDSFGQVDVKEKELLESFESQLRSSGVSDPLTTQQFCNVFRQPFCPIDPNTDEALPETRFGWSKVDRVDDTDEMWGVDGARQTRQGALGPVWRFGTATEGAEGNPRLTYEANAWERLVTPSVSLSDVGGEWAELTYWEKYEVMPNDARRILIQAKQPTVAEPEGAWAQWQTLETTRTSSTMHSATQCPGTPGADAADRSTLEWCQARVAIPEQYLGKEVRFAFELESTRLAAPLRAGTQTGFTWLLDEVGVEADSLAGSPIRLRLRAATDGSINTGHWQVESVQLTGAMYEHNIAVLPDPPMENRRVPPGGTLDLHGQVRNLGVGSAHKLFLELSVEPVTQADGDTPTDATVRFLDAEGTVLDTGSGSAKLGPINLGAAGAPGIDGQRLDARDYTAQVVFPNGDGDGYRLRMAVLKDGVLLADENLGDHERLSTVTLGRDPSWMLTFDAAPPTVGPGAAASFLLGMENTGNVPIDFSQNIEITAERLWAPPEAPDFEDGTVIDQSLAPLQVGESRSVVLAWNDPPAGFYRIKAILDPSGLGGGQPPVTHLMAGSKPLFFAEDFTSDPFAADWERNKECGPFDSDCWRLSNSFQGIHSLFVGSEAPGGTYASTTAWAKTPSLDLSWLAPDPNADKEIREGTSPFSPYLSMAYYTLMQGGDSVSVQAQRPGVSGPRDLLTGDSLTGADERQRTATYPLFRHDNRVLEPDTQVINLLGPHPVAFQLDFNGQSGQGQAFAVDLMTISAYDVSVSPDRYDMPIDLGSDKVYHFRVENTGAADDTYMVRAIEDPHSPLFSPDVGVQVEVLDEELRLEPGQVGSAAVRVTVPFQEMGALLHNTEFEVEIASTADPNRAVRATIHFDFDPPQLPDLVTRMQRPGGQSGPVLEGEPTTFAVTVENTRPTPSRATELVLLPCPKPSETEVSLSDCRKEKLWQKIDEKFPLTVPIPALKNGEEAHRTFSWVPPRGSTGDYTIYAIADPHGIVSQFDPDSSIDQLPLRVNAVEMADLHVTELRVLDIEGQPVDRAFAGDVLRIEGTVENRGTATAPDTVVSIINQFVLREERFSEIRPGANETLSVLWVAEAGNWVVQFEAFTNGGELNSDNNAGTWPLAVRKGDVSMSWTPAILQLQPGQDMQVDLRIENRRDHTVEVDSRIVADDVDVKGLPASLSIARGASMDFPVNIALSPFAAAGRHDVRVDLVPHGTDQVMKAALLEVHAGADRRIRVTHDPVVTPPGIARVPITFTNAGTTPEAFEVHATAPDDWIVTLLQPSMRLEPAARHTGEAVIEIPAGTAPGRYSIHVGAPDGLVGKDVPVDVTSRAVWLSEVQGEQDDAGQRTIMVRVENAGNTAGAPPFSVDGASYHIDPPPMSQEPGEVRMYRVTIQAGEASMRLPGQTEAAPVMAAQEASAVELTGMDLQGPSSARSGDLVEVRMHVRNPEMAAQEMLVGLWVDGKLAVEERLDLEAGETRDVTLKWRAAQSGPRVLTATVGSGEEATSRSIVIDIVADDRSLGAPGPGLVVPLAALAALAVLFRRRRS